MYPQTTGRAPGTDAKQLYSRYLGEPNMQVEPNPYDEQAYAMRDLPSVYRNKRLFLQDTIEGFILDNFEWYTFVIPWFVTNEMHVEMNIYRYNHVPAGPVPNKGISRLITDSTSVFSDSVSRFGLAFMMEGDKMGTPEGDVSYMRSIMGISQGCQELVNQSTAFALLACKNYYQDWQSRFRQAGDPIEQIMQFEVDQFAILAETRDGLDKIVEQRKVMMRRERAVPDSMIVFPDFPWHEAMVGKGTFMEYYMTGPMGAEILMQGPESFGTFRDLVVYTTREFNTHQRGRFVQPLVRTTAFGEYYPLVFETRRREDFSSPGSFKTQQRNAMVYNLEIDNFAPLEFRQCVIESRFWHGRDYHPEVYKLLDQRNRELRSNARSFDDKQRRYANTFGAMEMLDTQESRVPGERDEFMLFAHDVENRELFAAHYMGHLDLDVLKSQDLRSIAQMLLASVISDDIDVDALRNDISEAKKLVADIELQGYDDAYWKALVAENAARSIANDGTWVGEIATDGVRDFVPNKYGSLDLPVKTAGSNYPAGYGNMPGLRTIAEQAVAKGWPLALQDRAKAAVKVLETYSHASMKKAPQSLAIDMHNSPPWFHVKTDELSAMEYIMGRRDPLFVHVPRYTGVDRAAGETEPTGLPPAGRGLSATNNNNNTLLEDITQWAPLPGNNYNRDANVYLGFMPMIQWIALMTEARNADGTADPAKLASSNLEAYFSAFTAAPGEFTEKEKLRDSLIKELRKRMHIGSEDPVVVYYATNSLTTDIIARLFTPANATVDGAKKILAEIKTTKASLGDQEKAWLAQYEKQPPSSQKDIVAIGTNLLNQRISDQETALYNIPAGGPGIRAALTEQQKTLVKEIGKRLDSPVSGRGDDNATTFMTQFAESVEAVEKLGRKHSAVARFSWPIVQQWSELLTKSNFLNSAEKKDINEKIAQYNRALRTVHQQALDVVQRSGLYAADSSSSSSVSGDMHLDAAESLFAYTGATLKQVDPARLAPSFFRAPLTNSAALMRSISVEEKPEIRPADPATNMRTVFNPWANTVGIKNTKTAREELRRVFERPAFAEIRHSIARPFEQSSLLNRFVQHSQLSDEQQGVAGFVAHPDLHGGLVDDATFVPHDEFGDYIPRWDGNSERFAQHVDRVRKRRNAAGLTERTFDRELSTAYSIETQRKRARLIEDQERIADTIAAQQEYAAETLSRGTAAMHVEDFDALRAMRVAQTGAIDKNDDWDADLFNQFRGGGGGGAGGAGAGGGAGVVVDGPRATASGAPRVSGDENFYDLYRGSMAYRWKEAMAESDPLLRIAMLQVMLTPLNSLSAMLNMLDNNVNVPFNALAFRPWIEVDMYTIILLRSGMDTGGNVVGNTNFAMQASNMDKTFFGNFTFYHKTMIWREQNVSHLLDVFPKTYRTGWNMKFLKTPKEIKQAKRGSFIATLVPLTENEFPRAVCLIDTTIDRLLPTVTNRPIESKRNDYSSAPYVTAYWGLSEEQARMTEDTCTYTSSHERINVLCFMGTHVVYNDLTRAITQWRFGTGHAKGNKTGHGAASVWYGKSLNLFPQQRLSDYTF